MRLLAALGVAALAAYGVAALRSTGTEPDLGARPTAHGQASVGTNEPLPLPTAQRLRSARLYATKRRGLVSFAAVGTRGELACYRCRVTYPSASVSKAMLLVAYLNRLAEDQKELAPTHKAQLDLMIRVSDNAAASAIYSHVGHKGLHRFAEEAGMADFEVSGSWASARITAADQARFFARMHELAAPEYQAYVRILLSSIVPRQAWGIPEIAHPDWQVFFKGGWLTTRRGSLVHQVARLEEGASSLTIAILTNGNPSGPYGRETIRGIASRLLGR